MNPSHFGSIFVFVMLIFALDSFGTAEASCPEKSNSSCSECVGLKDNCFWCSATRKCAVYDPKKGSSQKDCPSSKAYYKQCYISGNLLIIIIPCVVGGLLLIIGCTIYCCCCRKCCGKKKQGMFDKEDKKLRKERNERRHLQDSRKAERQARHEEIRLKYGLKQPSGDSRYQRLDP